MIGRFRFDGTVLFANGAYARACGFAGTDMRGLNLCEILPPDRIEEILTLLTTLTRDASEVRFEERAGENWTLWKYCATDFDERGAWREVEVIGIDVTETKRMQNDLLKANALLLRVERDLNRAQRVAKIGSWWLDGRSGFCLWSDETYRIFGISRGEPRTFELFLSAVHPDDRACVEAAWSSALANKTDLNVQHRIAVGGAIKWLHQRASLSLDEDGRLVEACGTCQDITERKGWELELERRVAERTLAVSVARDEATRANAEKSRFLSAASHDLRQPLQAASLFTGALKRRVASEDQIALCDKLERSLSSASDMLRALLDMSRLESGAVAREPRAFRLQELIERVIANNRAMADGRGLRIVNGPNDLVAYTDAALFERIVDNFVANAVRYTEPGGIITISSYPTEGGLGVAVQDTGIGIPEHALGRIFDEYVQVGNAERASAKGLGLGLAIAKHVANLIGCRLHVTSRVGHGSTFSVETAAASAPSVQRVAAAPESTCTTAARPILILEDDPLVAEAVSMILEDAGFTVTCVKDGDEALASLRGGFRPVAILSDYWLPHENGVIVIGRLRAAIDAIVPVVFMTGDTSLQTRDVTLERCEVMHKPLDAKHILGALHKLAA